MLTVGNLIDVLSTLSKDTYVHVAYDSFCGGTDFDDGYGIIIYNKPENTVILSCSSLDRFDPEEDGCGCYDFTEAEIVYPVKE